jgi:phosphatidate cytidylyltransferase
METRAERSRRRPAPEPQEPKKSRAGRNLPAAIGIGVTLGAVVVASLVLRKELFLVVMAAAIAVGAWELTKALAGIGIRASLVPLLLGAVSMILSAYLRGPEALMVTYGLTLVAILVWRVADGVRGATKDLVGGLFIATYPCFLAGFVALMLAQADGHLWVFFFVMVTVASDIGGYAAGVTLGRHPMAPTVSPKKSWEGFAGSVAFCAAVGATALHFMLHGSWVLGAGIGVAAAVAATIGDLMESLLKRDVGIKDMSSILPGHGGIMDRLDSLVMTAPLVWALLTYLLPAT